SSQLQGRSHEILFIQQSRFNFKIIRWVYNTLQCTGRLISGIAKFFPLTGKLLLFLIKLASNFGTDGFVKGLLFFPRSVFFLKSR
ncbi:hypothetical protein ACR91K_24635, partial [Klebsiella pneumoniae]